MLRLILAIMVLLPFLPFANERVLRMAGDEKVYLNQAVEMYRSGHLFFQTMADQPSYFKGPLHYLLIELGLKVFGNHLLAGLWMNALFMLIGAIAMFNLGNRRWGPRSGFLLGLATSLNVGVFSHAFASQMEVELTAFTALGISILGLAPEKYDPKSARCLRSDLWFWVCAGVLGWVKSPLHSVLLGTGAIAYWALTKQLVPRLLSARAWFCVLLGALVSTSGYLPAYLGDKQAFLATYLGRETFQKGGNNRAWHYPVLPLIHFALPWTLIVFAGAGKWIHRLFSGKRRFIVLPEAFVVDTRMVKLGLAVAIPTILFWMDWDYKGQNYTLPILPALLLFGFACFAKPHLESKIPHAVFRLTALAGVIALFVWVALLAHFWPLPAWWPKDFAYGAAAMIAVFTICFAYGTTTKVISLGALSFFFAFALAIAPLGEREMVDARAYLKEHPNTRVYYYDLEPNIWSEWALLQLTLHHEIFGLHQPQQIAAATAPGNTVMVPHAKALSEILRAWKKAHPADTNAPVISPWHRWLTKGKSPEGESMWKVAWEKHSLAPLEREFFIVYFPPRRPIR